jgi:Prenyltransferase and squalene oxidase repeat
VTLGSLSRLREARANTLPTDFMKDASDTSFVQRVCLPLLVRSQNQDGGWGFHPASESRVEPTCWALLAISSSSSLQGIQEENKARATRFLCSAQLPDGSWPAMPEERTGCWVTSLACWTLSFDKTANDATAAGLKWLCDDWPQDSSLWSRFLRRLSPGPRLSPHNDAYRGWGWTVGTSSWVEPTSFALLALKSAPAELLPAGARRRRRLAEALLYDRMCPGGGWNCGNPVIYGVAGEPLVVPTVWALLALRDSPQRTENLQSLGWLQSEVEKIQGPGSLALARICLELYSRSWPENGHPLRDFYAKNEFLQNIPVIAWVCLALERTQGWPGNPARKIPHDA